MGPAAANALSQWLSVDADVSVDIITSEWEWNDSVKSWNVPAVMTCVVRTPKPRSSVRNFSRLRLSHSRRWIRWLEHLSPHGHVTGHSV